MLIKEIRLGSIMESRLEDKIAVNLSLREGRFDKKVYNIIDSKTEKIFGQIHTGIYDVGGMVGVRGDVVRTKIYAWNQEEDCIGNIILDTYGREDVNIRMIDMNWIMNKLGFNNLGIGSQLLPVEINEGRGN